MDTKIARLMLENLVDRIERNPKTGKRHLGGAISDREFEAIEFALTMMEDDPTLGTSVSPALLVEQGTSKSGKTIAKPREVDLNLASLERDKPSDDYVKLCLDFGTAMSKAFATRESDDDLLSLPLGRRGKEPNMIFPVSSTLYIGRDDKIYFGSEAITKSLSDQHSGRLRFDSPKQHMSRGDFSTVIDTIVDKKINPSPFEFTTGELITLYLSFLTDLACIELVSKNVSRYVLRRFAMPCWPEERAQWAELQMKKMVAKAQILADSFSEKWTGGLDVALVRGALDALKRLDRLPEYLVDGGVSEAIAAASSCLPRGSGSRRLYMVVDVGAGTTDYGLFAVVAPKGMDDQPRFYAVPGTALVLRQGGDTIDKILLQRILDQESINLGDAEYDDVNSNLRLRIRILKENMFREGSADYNLPTDATGSVSKDDFLKDERVVEFEKMLVQNFRKSLEKADPSWIHGLADYGLTVMLTGGGARLPMVRALGDEFVDVHGRRLRCKLAPDVPSWIIEQYPTLENEYPQLAVSIGGAAEERPDQRGQYEQLGISTDTGPRTLDPHYKG